MSSAPNSIVLPEDGLEREAISPLKVLVAHNFYQQAGGEDQCVAAEVAMLRAYKHEVIEYSISNDVIDKMGYCDLAARTIWSQPAFLQLRQLFRAHRPDI